MRFFRFLMRGLDLQTLSCSGQIRLGHWAMAGNSCLREGLCSQLNGGFFCLWSLQELPGNMLKHSKFHWMKRPKIHIYLNKYIYIHIYIFIVLGSSSSILLGSELLSHPYPDGSPTRHVRHVAGYNNLPYHNYTHACDVTCLQQKYGDVSFWTQKFNPKKQPTWEGDSWSQRGIQKSIHKGSAVPFAFPGWYKKWRPSG